MLLTYLLKKLKSASRFGSYRPPGGHWIGKNKFSYLESQRLTYKTNYALFLMLITYLKIKFKSASKFRCCRSPGPLLRQVKIKISYLQRQRATYKIEYGSFGCYYYFWRKILIWLQVQIFTWPAATSGHQDAGKSVHIKKYQ